MRSICSFWSVLCLLVVIVGAVPGQDVWVAGEVLVGPAAHRSVDLVRSLRAQGVAILEKDAISGVLRVAVPAGSEAEWIAILSGADGVAYAERNGVGSGGAIPNDTFFGSQWHLQNTGQSGGLAGADIEATTAWDISTGSPNTVIAVLDTGIDTDHPEFAGRIDPDGQDFVNEDADPEADHPHGSEVAGCIVANANNAFGVTGVDWQAKVLPIKVLDQLNLGTTFDLAQGLNYVATQADVQVVSMSLVNYPNNMTLVTALQAASSAGKILIACAGNGGIGNADVSYPGASPLTISIGATTRTDARASFSSTGLALDFMAPGQAVVTVAHGTFADTTSTVQGCSFATPITSGVVGLFLARAESLGLPTLTQAEVFNLLQAGAEDQVGPPGEDGLGPDSFFGEGRINARASLQALSSIADCGAGNVGLAAGGPFDVLTVNGLVGSPLDRRAIIGVGEPVTIAVVQPPSNPTPSPFPPGFILWGTLGEPGPADLFSMPFSLGDLCFTPFDANPGQAGLFTLASSYPLPSAFVSATIAPWSITFPPFPFPAVLTFQGLILDSPQGHVGLTNAVVLDARVLPPPVVTTVGAPTGAGAAITITGSGFAAGALLTLAGNAIVPTSVTPTQIVFTLPASVPCGTTLVVTNPNGQTASLGYNLAPVITNILTPLGAPSAGGVLLIVVGQNFVPGSTLTIGGVAATVNTASGVSIVAISPPGTPGPAAVVVTTPFGCVGNGTYTYAP